jgi:tetratricopeptide (TPR) repeat protein
MTTKLTLSDPLFLSPAAPISGRVFPVAALAVAALIDGLAVLWLLGHAATPSVAWPAAAMHLASALPLLFKRTLAPSQRSLALALCLALPLVGALVAAVVLGTRGRSEIAQAVAEEESLAPLAAENDDVFRLTEALSCCEALLSADVEQRRAILSALNHRGDANAIRILRWALGASDTDLAVEAALALEDVNAAFEARLAACREELAANPTFAAALAVGETVVRGLETGIIDAPLVPLLAQESRVAYERAGTLDPARYDVAAASRAEMELLLLRPDNAIECIDHALPTASPGMRDELLALRQEAVLASHALPWEGPSALATYRPPPLPAPYSARRAALPSVGRASGGTGARAVAERTRTSPRIPLFPILGSEVANGDS